MADADGLEAFLGYFLFYKENTIDRANFHADITAFAPGLVDLDLERFLPSRSNSHIIT